MERIPAQEDARGGPMDASAPGAALQSHGPARSLRALCLLPSALSITRRWLRRRGVARGLADMLRSFRAGHLLGMRRMWLDEGEPLRYAQWLRMQESLRAARGSRQARISRLRPTTRFLVVVDGRDARASAARATRVSVARQAFPPHIVVCLTHDPDAAWWREDDTTLLRPGWEELRGVLTGSGARSVVVLQAGELLHADALLRIAEALDETPEARVVYADHDRIDGLGARYDPWFKPAWDPDLLLEQDYLGPPTAVSVAALPRQLGFRDTAPGLLAWAVKLYAAHGLSRDVVHHLREVIAHVGGYASKPEDDLASGMVARFLASRGVPAVVEQSRQVGWRVRRLLSSPVPRVSVIVPTRDQLPLLDRCVESVLSRTDYPDLELLVVDNRSSQPATHVYLDRLAKRSGVRVLQFDAPFNFAALNNWAVRQAEGALVCLLNNDTEVISPEWMTEMVSHAVRPEVGAVGAMLYYPDNTIQHAGVQLGLAGFLGHRCLRRPHGFAGPHECLRHVQQMHVVTAACLVIRRAVYEEVNGMDEEAFPVAYNDVDFCLRIRDSGYRNLWTPHAELYHHESATRGSDLAYLPRLRLEAERRALIARWGARLEGERFDYESLI